MTIAANDDEGAYERALRDLIDSIGTAQNLDGKRSVAIPDLQRFWLAYDSAVHLVRK